MKTDVEKRAKIRARASYRMYEVFAKDSLLTGPHLSKAMRAAHRLLNAYSAFRSAKASDNAYESMDLLLEDIKGY